ncbi:hypothetical protein BDY21DRAFT_274619, partial [Lineolata rhizophorae]
MLWDLQKIIETYYEMNSPEARPNAAHVVIQYLMDMKLDDVSGNLRAALGLLAWSEQATVHWELGYMEAFVHTVGMLTQSTFDAPEFKALSNVTRHNLENAYNALQIKVLDAEEKLESFGFDRLWHAHGVSTSHPAHKSYGAFRDFVVSFYTQVYGQWPPPAGRNGRWLTRSMIRRLQEDFGAMYDYLVDRDVGWDGSEERHTRKWEIVPRRPRPEGFEADWPGLPITDMFCSFDSFYGYAHIPHPYPLLPQTGAGGIGGKANGNHKEKKGGLFSSMRKAKAVATRDPKEQFQTSIAFNGATNINKLGTSFESNDLIDNLIRYEKSLQLTGVSPPDARMGRWILLYGILQVVSTLAVDTEGLRYKGTQYFLCPQLGGCPPWV